MRILGIDPGFERVGIAIVEQQDGQKETLLFSECFQTSSKLSFPERLLLIGSEISKVINDHSPERLSIETLFFNTNQKTAMQVAEARGVIIHEAMRAGLVVEEYTPLQIKTAVTGYGKADKDQVALMVRQLISLPKDVKYDDEMDAIAAGLTSLATKNWTKGS